MIPSERGKNLKSLLYFLNKDISGHLLFMSPDLGSDVDKLTSF